MKSAWRAALAAGGGKALRITIEPTAARARQRGTSDREQAVRGTVRRYFGDNVTTNTSLQQEILSLESRRIDAMTRQDLATLDAILADDLSYTHSSGNTDTKAGFLSLVASPGAHGRYRSVDYAHVEVVPLGEAVIVRGRAQITLEGYDGAPDRSYPVLFLDVYERRGGEWRMVAWQATRAHE